MNFLNNFLKILLKVFEIIIQKTPEVLKKIKKIKMHDLVPLVFFLNLNYDYSFDFILKIHECR